MMVWSTMPLTACATWCVTSCSRLRPLRLDASPTVTMPIGSEGMAIHSPGSHSCVAAPAVTADDDASPCDAAAIVPDGTGQGRMPVTAVLHAAGTRRPDVSGSASTPYQRAASPAACAMPATVTESLSSGWLDQLLPKELTGAATWPQGHDTEKGHDTMGPSCSRPQLSNPPVELNLADTASAASCSSELPTDVSAAPWHYLHRHCTLPAKRWSR